MKPFNRVLWLSVKIPSRDVDFFSTGNLCRGRGVLLWVWSWWAIRWVHGEKLFTLSGLISPGAKHWPYGQPEVEEGQLPRYLKDLRIAFSYFSGLYFLFTVINNFFAEGIYLQDRKRGIISDKEIWVWTNEWHLAVGYSMTWNISKMKKYIICPTTKYWI